MSLRTAAKYVEGFKFFRLMPHGPDGLISTPIRVVGGIGPFDFSAASVPAAVPIKWKIDNGAELSDDVDITDAVDDAAVTVDELITAITAAPFTGLTASKEAVTGRFKLAITVPGAAVHFQVYGEFANIVGIGQGFGCEFIRSDTMKSFQETPSVKASETLTTTDANGKDTEVITDGYRKGFTGTLVDTAIDAKLKALMEGGHYDETTKIYEAPTIDDTAPTFWMEVYSAIYHEGTNKEPDLVGYVKKLYRSCKGAIGQMQHQRGWADGNYTVVGTTYKDSTGALLGDIQETELTVAQYEALHLLTV
jgi:hypothetical protein